MATLEDAAEDLVVKLRGLESEIAESGQKLEALRDRMETARTDLEADWTDLADAVESLMDTVREQGQQLEDESDEALQAVAGAHEAVGENARGAQAEIGQAAAGLDALGQQASALAPEMDSLVADGVEAPAQSLEDRAQELQQELGRLVDEARDFFQDEVVPAVEQMEGDVRQRCQELHRTLTEDRAQPLQDVFDEWSGHIDEVETYVVQHGYATSRQHAHDVAEYAMEKCESGCRQHLEELTQVVGLLEGQLRQLATGLEHSGDGLAQQAGRRLLDELEEARQAAQRAVTGLDSVRQELAAHSFMEA